MTAGDRLSPQPGAVVLNPSASELGKRHAVLWGRGRRYRVEDFPGPLSIKTVTRGSALWETAGGRFPLDSGRALILNEGRRYSIAIDSREIVETFCVFFRRGFAGEALRARSAPAMTLLDDPAPGKAAEPEFPETLLARDRGLIAEMDRLRTALSGADPSELYLEDRMLALLSWLLRAKEGLQREASRLPAVRSSTRAENHRRLRRARDYMESSLAEPLSLDRIAREACLSPYHFHRLFTEIFRETPHTYLRRRRLERARELLVASDLPVTEICLETGYRSPGSFSNLFRRRYGLAPRQFRRAFRRD
jgi:AraC family transcriptional regulator